MRNILTLAQGDVYVVLLVGAGLFIQSLETLRSRDLGIDVPYLARSAIEAYPLWRGE